MQKLKVLVVFGGVSNEYEVSLRSAAAIIDNMDREKFDVKTMGVTKDGRWLLYSGDTAAIADDSWQKSAVPALISPDRETHGILVLENGAVRSERIDAVFPAVHGQNCENGALQGLLDTCAIPYVGCGVAASAISFDKVFTHIVAESAGIPMARWQLACREEDIDAAVARIAKALGFPCFVKPANSGSSVGCSGAKNEAELKCALQNAFLEDRRVVIEEFIGAHEVECAVIGNLETEAPTTGEIVSPDGFYDYDTKYKNDNAKLLIPAGISEQSADEVRRLAQKVYKALDCRGLSRVDFFVKKGGEVLFNEINTMPGFTSISMYPKMMISSGLTYSGLLTRLIELAIEERERRIR